jgi:hypothetical protein
MRYSLGLVLLVGPGICVATLPAQQQQQPDTSRRGWGIVYSSPKSRASGTNVNASSNVPPLVATPAAGTPPPPTVLPTIRGSRSASAPDTTSVIAPSHANGIYAGDRQASAPVPPPPAAATATVAASGTYDTVPPAAASSGGSGVHLDELMSLHEYTATGLTSLKPQEVQNLEQWLERYREALIDSATRAAQRMVSAQPSVPAPVATPAANTRAVAPTNAHAVTGIRSGSRFVQIDDGSVWDIYPADQSETAQWQVGDFVQVRVANQAYGDFDHELVNSQRTGPVRAKFMGYAKQ